MAFYAACLTAASALTLAVWLHAKRTGLLDPGADPVVVRANTARSMASVGVFALSVPVGLLGLGPALVWWVVLPPTARAVAARPRAVRVSAPRT